MGSTSILRTADAQVARDLQGCAGGQQCGPGHAHTACLQAFAADDGYVAIAPLVAGVRASLCCRWAGQPCAVRLCGGVAAQVVEPDAACRIAPGASEQAWLERKQGQGVPLSPITGIGMGGEAGRVLAGVALQSRRQIHRQQRGRAVA